MNKVIVIMSYVMAVVMSIFSPLSVSHGSQGCCAECTLKKEDELELVHDEEEPKTI